MIQECERLVRRERREPERQPRELHRCGVEIDAEQATLGHQPSERHAIGFVEVAYALLDNHAVTRLTREGSNLISRNTILQ